MSLILLACTWVQGDPWSMGSMLCISLAPLFSVLFIVTSTCFLFVWFSPPTFLSGFLLFIFYLLYHTATFKWLIFFISFVLCLSFKNVTNVGQVQPLPLPSHFSLYSLLIFSPSIMCCFITQWIHLVDALCAFGIGPSTGAWVASHSCRRLTNLTPEASQLQVGLHEPFLHLYWDFGRLGLVQAFKITTAMSPWVWQPCYVQETLSLQMSAPSGSFDSFTLCHADPWALDGESVT